MKRTIALLFALTGWFAIIAQYLLMINNSTNALTLTTLNFISFFTILTNTGVAVYFTGQSLNAQWSNKPGFFTALTVYITVVGLVYQFMLRHLWQPEGLQKVVDELLHSIIPLFAVFYWYRFENKAAVQYGQFINWLIYPLAYLAWILVWGSYTGFYPYPFVNVPSIGFIRVLVNSFFLLLFFSALSALYIFIGKALSKK